MKGIQKCHQVCEIITELSSLSFRISDCILIRVMYLLLLISIVVHFKSLCFFDNCVDGPIMGINTWPLVNLYQDKIRILMYLSLC